MSRTRAYRRAHRERVIARRLRHIREWDGGFYSERRRQNDYWGHDVPGRWAKQDPYAHGRCYVCREAQEKARLRLQKRLDKEVIEQYLRR